MYIYTYVYIYMYAYIYMNTYISPSTLMLRQSSTALTLPPPTAALPAKFKCIYS